MLIVLGLGCVNLFYPLGIDQWVAMLGARSIGDGGTLYVDYWDNKQPALYYLIFWAGELFGYSEVSVHLMELMWMLAFAIVLMVTLRPMLENPWLSALAPVASIGVYYASAGVQQLSQLEIFIGFPVYVSLYTAWLAAQRPQCAVSASFIGGIAGGIVALFKLVYTPLVAVIWMFTVVWILRREAQQLRNVVRITVAFVAGLLIPLGIVVLYFWHLGALEELLWTAFVYPREVFDVAPLASKTRLVTMSAFFMAYFAPWTIFAVIALLSWWRRRDNLAVSLHLCWLLVGCLLVYIQRFSWWGYHALIFFVPVGILAVFGLDQVFSYFRALRLKLKNLETVLAVVLLLPLCASLSAPFIQKSKKLISELLIKRAGVAEYHMAVEPRYRELRKDAHFLALRDALPGPIYVFGNPYLYWRTGRALPHALPGASWEYYLPQQITETLAAIKAQRVPYLFVEDHEDKLFYSNTRIAKFISQHYVVHHVGDSGTWYQIRQGEYGA